VILLLIFLTVGSAVAAAASYKITATAGTGGTISPGTVSFVSGASQKFTFSPNSGYKISDVKVDGASKGAIVTYTFTNVNAAHSIVATFLPH